MNTKSETADLRSDSPISATLLDQLARETAHLAYGALGGHDIRQIWSELNCIPFRLADGRTGSAELLINWDVTDEGVTAEPIDTAPRLILPRLPVVGSLAP